MGCEGGALELHGRGQEAVVGREGRRLQVHTPHHFVPVELSGKGGTGDIFETGKSRRILQWGRCSQAATEEQLKWCRALYFKACWM